MDKAFFISIPHSGEQVPAEATWLQGLPEPILMCDVDRYVDRLYEPAFTKLNVPTVICPWHRYAVDLNRLPGDVDASSVLGSSFPEGQFKTGLHWVETTRGHRLMKAPISEELHRSIVDKYFEPFHEKLRQQYERFFASGFKSVFHIDAHSMPSMGTSAHRDPGQRRAEVVISDVDGVSSKESFKDLVMEAYKQAGFEVAYNWPYKGGRLTQTYGRPAEGQNVIQVELNRSLYMDEETKRPIHKEFQKTQHKIESAVTYILNGL